MKLLSKLAEISSQVMSQKNLILPKRRPVLFWVGLATIFLGAAATTPMGPPATGATTCIRCGVLSQNCQIADSKLTDDSFGDISHKLK